MSNPGLVSGALKSVSLPLSSDLSLVPLTVRPQSVSAMPSSSAVMIDLTAEDDGRTRQQQQQQNAIVPSGILGSIMQPGNMVIAPNSSAYLLYTPPTRPAVIKPSEVAGVASLPTIALGSSMATGEGYHSLPSLVSINNRPGAVLQVVNMRPPPPLQSAPLRSALPVLAPANIQRIAVVSDYMKSSLTVLEWNWGLLLPRFQLCPSNNNSGRHFFGHQLFSGVLYWGAIW